MINKKNLWFLTLFSLVLVLSVYYITMPNELLQTNNNPDSQDGDNVSIDSISLIETLKQSDELETIDELNKLKATISNQDASVDKKNEAFDAIKLLNQISSQEELIEEKIKTNHELDSFVKIDGDQIRVVIEGDNHSQSLANDIMRTVQSNFKEKQYISIQFK